MNQKQTLRVGVGGPVGSGKTALLRALCSAMREPYNIAVEPTISIPGKMPSF